MLNVTLPTMTEEQILKAFEGRWRIKSQNIDIALNGPYSTTCVRNLCLDFFRTGILIAEGDNRPSILLSTIVDADVEVNGFDFFWDSYDKKVGKPKCEKLWSKLTLEEKKACLLATPAYVASTPDKQFRKNPLTFLNQKAWNDEIIIRDSPNLQRQQRLADSAELVAKYTGADNRTKK